MCEGAVGSVHARVCVQRGARGHAASSRVPGYALGALGSLGGVVFFPSRRPFWFWFWFELSWFGLIWFDLV